MSLLSAVLLVLAAAVVVGAEWPRIARSVGVEARAPRRKRHLRAVPDQPPTASATADADAFVESVRRDLDRLPTFERDPDR